MQNNDETCDMRGFLSFLILWILSIRPMSGSEMASEIEKRKGIKPNPGTIYPALAELTEKKAIAFKNQGKKKVYTLTPKGKEMLKHSVNHFCKVFYDILSK